MFLDECFDEFENIQIVYRLSVETLTELVREFIFEEADGTFLMEDFKEYLYNTIVESIEQFQEYAPDLYNFEQGAVVFIHEDGRADFIDLDGEKFDEWFERTVATKVKGILRDKFGKEED